MTETHIQLGLYDYRIHSIVDDVILQIIYETLYLLVVVIDTRVYSVHQLQTEDKVTDVDPVKVILNFE